MEGWHVIYKLVRRTGGTQVCPKVNFLVARIWCTAYVTLSDAKMGE